MNRCACVLIAAGSLACVSLYSQSGAPESTDAQTTIRVSSRAVLVDVIVTDSHGKPVTGLKQEDFSVTESGKPQTLNFFEEHSASQALAPVEMPKLPPNVFSNFSPFPQPPAVTVLLLDSLNTRMENQSFVHKQAVKFLNTAKPGSRMAIFTMGLGLHFIQGFNDDPAVLMAALKNKKNNEVQTSVMLKGQDETNAQAKLIGMMSSPVPSGGGASATAASGDMIASLQTFMNENDDSRSVDRVLLTLANFQRLATFLDGFPGRKNVIWFSESFPLVISGNVNPQLSDQYGKTMAMLASARVAFYPVDAEGVSPLNFYTAESNPNAGITSPSQMTMNHPADLLNEDQQRDLNQTTMKFVAEETGGKAFANTNGLAQIVGDVSGLSKNFYTLSYTPINFKMDHTYRKIDVKVEREKYNLSFRRGYIAADEAVPGSAEILRQQAIRKLAVQNPGAVDPLLPFMGLGMPQSEQILYKAKVQPIPTKEGQPANEKDKFHYGIDFAVDLKDLNLKLAADGLHTGNLNVSLIAYDRYGNIVSRNDHLVSLDIKPDVYAVYQNTGVQLHAEIAAP
jgi:VWFA-related protein